MEDLQQKAILTKWGTDARHRIQRAYGIRVEEVANGGFSSVLPTLWPHVHETLFQYSSCLGIIL